MGRFFHSLVQQLHMSGKDGRGAGAHLQLRCSGLVAYVHKLADAGRRNDLPVFAIHRVRDLYMEALCQKFGIARLLRAISKIRTHMNAARAYLRQIRLERGCGTFAIRLCE